jgi:hypothetical protein
MEMNLFPLHWFSVSRLASTAPVPHGSEGSRCLLAFKSAGNVGDDWLAAVVEKSACTELFHELEVLGRVGCDDFVACGDGELSGVAAQTGCSSPDKKCPAGWYSARYIR